MSLYLHGVGHFHPEHEITNAFLEELDIGTNEDWIMERVGIRSRRTVLPLDYIRETRNRDTVAALEAASYTHADTGARAARMAVERAGIDMRDIGMVITGSSRPTRSRRPTLATSPRPSSSRCPASTSTRRARASSPRPTCSPTCGPRRSRRTCSW
jgi:3-oxoacyl-[acyl-carrier-protein] synthase III